MSFSSGLIKCNFHFVCTNFDACSVYCDSEADRKESSSKDPLCQLAKLMGGSKRNALLKWCQQKTISYSVSSLLFHLCPYFPPSHFSFSLSIKIIFWVTKLILWLFVIVISLKKNFFFLETKKFSVFYVFWTQAIILRKVVRRINL